MALHSEPRRIEITRAQYFEMTGLVPDPWTIGSVIYADGLPVLEYLFVDDSLADVEWLENLYKL